MKRSSRAWALIDAVVGLGIISVLTGVVAVEMSWRSKAESHLEHLRSATALAELTLDELQQGQPPRAGKNADLVRIEKIAGGAPVSNYAWVRVTATRDGQSVSLVGLVKADAIGGK